MNGKVVMQGDPDLVIEGPLVIEGAGAPGRVILTGGSVAEVSS